MVLGPTNHGIGLVDGALSQLLRQSEGNGSTRSTPKSVVHESEKVRRGNDSGFDVYNSSAALTRAVTCSFRMWLGDVII